MQASDLADDPRVALDSLQTLMSLQAVRDEIIELTAILDELSREDKSRTVAAKSMLFTHRTAHSAAHLERISEVEQELGPLASP